MATLQSNFKNMVLSLTLICVISGLLLALTKTFTLERIEQAQKESKEKALREVLPTYDSISSNEINGNTLYYAYANNQLVGAAALVSTPGFADQIKVLVGFTTEGVLKDYVVLEQHETPGLGTKITTFFKSLLCDKKIESTLSVKKDGGEIDAITAATISSRCFLTAVNNAVKLISDNSQNDAGATIFNFENTPQTDATTAATTVESEPKQHHQRENKRENNK